MKMQRLLIIEVVTLISIGALAINFVSVNPILESNSGASLGLFDEKKYSEGTVTLERGGEAVDLFRYPSYEPAILTLNIEYLSVQKSGYLTILCNGRSAGRILATPGSESIQLTLVTTSGVEWVKANSLNAVVFKSGADDGYEGTFSYEISLRGSR
jgi:hypothetical protein